MYPLAKNVLVLRIVLGDVTQVETLECESRQSNPPPRLRWYLADTELLAASQTNETEEGDHRRWRAVSTLNHKFQKADFGKPLHCRVEHPAYAAGSHDATVTLDVLCKL